MGGIHMGCIPRCNYHLDIACSRYLKAKGPVMQICTVKLHAFLCACIGACEMHSTQSPFLRRKRKLFSTS